MIERLVTTLRALGEGAEGSAHPRLRADCADALRLQLDCPQQSLTSSQRASLARLNDLLEEPRTANAEVAALARQALTSLGLAAGDARAARGRAK